MMSCIIGAILICGQYASITIDGPLAYAYGSPASQVYNYALYAVPLQQQMPVFIHVGRRG